MKPILRKYSEMRVYYYNCLKNREILASELKIGIFCKLDANVDIGRFLRENSSEFYVIGQDLKGIIAGFWGICEVEFDLLVVFLWALGGIEVEISSN